MRIRKLREQDIQAGVLELLHRMPQIAWAYKVPVGDWVIVRPLRGASVRKQLQPAVNLGIIKASQVGFMRGAPESTPDIAFQLTGSGIHCELEVKRPGEKPTEEQERRIALVNETGGLAGWVSDVDQAQATVIGWAKL